MGCCHPFKGFRTGFKTDNGAEDFVLCQHATTELLDIDRVKKPILLANCPHVELNGHIYLSEPIDIPCGSCVGCRMASAREWKIRNCLEMTYEPACYFITLTYDDDHLPDWDFVTKEYLMRDLQLFFKRWRKRFGKFRYFGCFEYGEHTQRMHFHLLMYCVLPGLKAEGRNRFSCKPLFDTWKYGQIMVELVEPGSIAYVCGYVEKKQCDPLWETYPVKPFRFMSRRPAIGFRYLEDHRHLFGEDPHVYGKFSNDITRNHASLPSSFKRKLKEEEYYCRLKIAAEMAQESAYEVSKVVYKCATPSLLNDIIEDSMLQKIEKQRIGKL